MVAPTTKRMTVEEFEVLAQSRENADRRLEFVGGEIVEVVSRWYSSFIAAIIVGYVMQHVLKHRLGYFTTADGGYEIDDERYIPDVGFISNERMKGVVVKDVYIPKAPDLAVEVVSPSNSVREIVVKVSNYLAAGTVVWIVYPDQNEVHVHQPGKSVIELKDDATLDGGAILPNFSLKLTDIFLPPPADDEAKTDETES